MQSSLIIKLVLMVTFFLEVTIFGRVIAGLKCFKYGATMDIAMTFSGTLFLSIALVDIIPQAISNFDQYFSTNMQSFQSSSSLKQNQYFPLTLIISMVTFMIIMYIDKILIGQSHDHQYEVSFVAEPKKSHRDHPSVELKDAGRNDEFNNDRPNLQTQVLSNQSVGTKECNLKPFILQIGLSIHAFFECLAVGLQKTPIGVLSLASAILVHKWAEGLTLGLMYKKEGFKQGTINIMIIVQGLVNVLGLLTGCFLINQGVFVMALFMSISAGTFFYISLAQVLNEQVRKLTIAKTFAILAANMFISFLVWFQKRQQMESFGGG